jgi:striatin 1/3/4
MLPSRGYQQSYPPPRNFYGQTAAQTQSQIQAQGQPQNIYQQGQGQGQGQGPQHVLQQHGQQSQHENAQRVNGGPAAPDGAQAAGNGDGMANGGEMNLASVLHYLQSEWRRWERDRNEWEIERAEMRVSLVPVQVRVDE